MTCLKCSFIIEMVSHIVTCYTASNGYFFTMDPGAIRQCAGSNEPGKQWEGAQTNFTLLLTIEV